MPRVILITRKFPPVNETGSRRAAAFAKYLHRLGWEVTVVTSDGTSSAGGMMTAEEAQANAGMDSIECVYMKRYDGAAPCGGWLNGLRRRVAWDLVGLPFSESHLWSVSLQKELDGKEMKGDIIWATYPHVGALLAASWLSRKLGVPWVADFRDLPMEFEDRKWVLWMIMRRLRGITQSAACCITVSDVLTAQLTRAWRRRVVTIPNGFDPDWLCVPTPGLAQDVFRLVYTGTVVRSRDPNLSRDPNPIIRAVVELQNDGRIPRDRIRLEFYVSDTSWLAPENEEHVGRTVFISGFVGYSQVMSIQRQATVLIILSTGNVPGVQTTKLFEYMAAGRPVITFPKDPSGLDPVLESTGIGRSCATMEELKSTILQWYREWDTQGDIRLNRNLAEIGKWSRLKQAEILDEICREIIASSRHGRQRGRRISRIGYGRKPAATAAGRTVDPFGAVRQARRETTPSASGRRRWENP